MRRPLASLLLACGAEATFNFLSVGDWGCRPEDAKDTAPQVAEGMAKVAKEKNYQYVIGTGDNFYNCGAKPKDASGAFDEVFDTRFWKMYANVKKEKGTGGLPLWLQTLGNHDYGLLGSPDAQVQYGLDNIGATHWHMPNRYYHYRHQGPSMNISFIVVDTNPFIKSYCDGSKVDPSMCGTEPSAVCQNMGDVVATQNAQLAWLGQTLEKDVHHNDWLIGIGHHQATIKDIEPLLHLLMSYNLDLWLNGHEHSMIHYKLKTAPHFHCVTTGAGCKLGPLKGEDGDGVDYDDDDEYDEGLADVDVSAHPCDPNKHPDRRNCTKIKQHHVPGFTGHELSGGKKLTTTMYDHAGKALYSFTQEGPRKRSEPQAAINAES